MRHYICSDNYQEVAMKSYDNPFCVSEDEFKDDVQRASQIRKLLTRYDNNTFDNLRVLINHIISYYNVFDNDIATYMLFYRVKTEHHPQLKAIMVVLNLMTYGSMMDFRNINIDEHMLLKLSEVLNET